MKDAIVEHKDIPEGTEAHGGPTSEQRKDMMKKKAETPLCIGYNPPAILHVSLHGRGRVCEKQSRALEKGEERYAVLSLFLTTQIDFSWQ